MNEESTRLVYKWIECYAICNPKATNEQIAKSLKFWKFCSLKEAREYVKAWVLK